MLLLIAGFSAFIFIFSCPAESAPAISADARVLKAKIKIGDEIRLLLRVEHPRRFTVIPPDLKMNLAPFEVKQVEPVPVKKGQNRVEETFRMSLVVFQTGDLKIPPIMVRYADETGRESETQTEPVDIHVLSVGKKITDKDDIRAIKGPTASQLERFWAGLFAWLAGTLLVFLIVKIILRIMKERKNSESRKPPAERVKIELHRLKDKGYLPEKNYCEHYAGLADILRRYFDRRFGIDAFDKTSSEILQVLEARSVERELLKKTQEVLMESDLVKFAKFAPPNMLAETLETLLLEIVESTKDSQEKP